MATQTLSFGSFGNGAVRVELDINDANWRPSKVRVINESPHALVAIIKKAGAVVFEATAPGNQTTEWNISGIQLGWQPDYWNSITQQYEPDGIDLKDYEIGARWPA